MGNKKVSFQELANGVALATMTAGRMRPAGVVRSTYGATVKAVKALPEGLKMATQAKVVYAAIAKAGKTGITEQELAKALADPKSGLVTRQSPLRIFRFYRKMLVDGGYIACS
jgi:hypothetical protein